jgi:hypothetical protein
MDTMSKLFESKKALITGASFGKMISENYKKETSFNG